MDDIDMIRTSETMHQFLKNMLFGLTFASLSGPDPRRTAMRYRSLICALELVAALAITIGAAQASDDAKYPNWKGQWERFGGPPRPLHGRPGQLSFDQTKPWGPGQQAPLTPEYQAVLEASMADQANGGLGNYPQALCLAAGMPHMMIAFLPQEYIVTPETTYILIGYVDHHRRIFTDGRDWPTDIEPTYAGYSIGKWIDEDGDGRYDVLEAETRYLKGPRAFDASGLPMHYDNQAIFKERFYIDKADANVLHDEITVIDHALTRPWTVDKKYVRSSNPHPDWIEHICAENNAQVKIGKEHYYMSADGRLMPTRKDQPPPDLTYFKRSQK
jgi:hypothetical protein